MKVTVTKNDRDIEVHAISEAQFQPQKQAESEYMAQKEIQLHSLLVDAKPTGFSRWPNNLLLTTTDLFNYNENKIAVK